MKRLFLILCLITICNISYADIASTGYVDGVVAGKQDTIADIETIRSGAGLGATAVQPSSLSTVAKTGSYNDLSNKPTIPNIPMGPNDGKKYNLIWNGKTGSFVFEEMPREPLQCDASAGLYDIGFDRCVDQTINGIDYGAIDLDDRSRHNDVNFGLIENGTWATSFDYGIIKGRGLCSSTSGTPNYSGEPDEVSGGAGCWCQIIEPYNSDWVFLENRSPEMMCNLGCTSMCGDYVRRYSTFRSAMFGSVGN